ncbi:MAG: hypothetical protein HY720_05810 [Planctomycetes bacterium]|nr:hypothetical protein [Planctomycetota bacterium]
MTREARAVRAPGKLVLAGEYAVLWPGEPGIVAAVDRYAIGRMDRGEIKVDTEAFRDAATGKKLGLGSSAAAAVCMAALMAGETGAEELLPLARAAHDTMGQSGGSGIDLAASIRGGILLFRQGSPPERIETPEGLVLVAGWTGEEARTADRTEQVRVRLSADRAARRDFLVGSSRAVASLRSALEYSSEPELAGAIRQALAAMRDLDRATGAGIFVPSLDRAIEFADLLGLAAKPSGAGGGDCAIALTFDPGRARALSDAWRAAGIVPLDLAISPTGVQPASAERS